MGALGEQLLIKFGFSKVGVDKGVGEVTESISTLNGVLSQVGLGVGAASLLGWLREAVSYGSELNDTANALETNVESLQALQYEARKAGVDSGALTMVLGRMKNAAAEANDANSNSAKALKALGIATADFISLGADEQLEAVAKAYVNASNKTEAFGAVADLVGTKNAPRLNDMLKALGNEGLASVVENARNAGQVISGQLIEEMDRLDDKIAESQTRLKGWGAEAMSSILHFAEGLGIVAAKVANAFDGIETDTSALENDMLKASNAANEVSIAMLGTKATAADLKRLEESRLKVAEARVPEEQKSKFLVEQICKFTLEQSRYAKDTKEYIEATMKADEYRVKYIEQQTKMLEEQQKSAQGIYEEISKGQEKDWEQAQKLLSVDQQLAEHGKQRALLEGIIAEKKKSGADYSIEEALWTKEEVAIEKILADQAAIREVTEKNLTEEAIKQKVHSGEITAEQGQRYLNALKVIEAEKKITKENENQVELLKIAVGIRGRTDDQMSDRELERKRQNILNDIAERKRALNESGGLKFINNDWFLVQDQMHLAQLEKEMNFRETVRRNARQFGEDWTFMNTPGLTESRFRTIMDDKGRNDDSKRAADALVQINERLTAAGFFRNNSTSLDELKNTVDSRLTDVAEALKAKG